MLSTTPLNNITNNISNSLRAPRMNNIELLDIATASLMEGAPSPHVTHQDLHLWFEGIPETSWATLPPFQPTTNALGLELLANTAVRNLDNRSPSPIITHQEWCVNLQQFGEPPL